MPEYKVITPNKWHAIDMKSEISNEYGEKSVYE